MCNYRTRDPRTPKILHKTNLMCPQSPRIENNTALPRPLLPPPQPLVADFRCRNPSLVSWRRKSEFCGD
ncbi:hypothetical protein AKJ16_DCAP12167 [Drosera capensis]